MANISIETAAITGGTRGEDVRDAFVSACKKIASSLPPSVSESDAGYFATVNSDGVWEAEEWI